MKLKSKHIYQPKAIANECAIMAWGNLFVWKAQIHHAYTHNTIGLASSRHGLNLQCTQVGPSISALTNGPLSAAASFVRKGVYDSDVVWEAFSEWNVAWLIASYCVAQQWPISQSSLLESRSHRLCSMLIMFTVHSRLCSFAWYNVQANSDLSFYS